MDIESLSDFVKWRKATYAAFPTMSRLDLRDYLTSNVNVSQTAAITQLLMPELVGVRGCIVLAERSDASYLDEWAAAADGTARSIELAVNLVQLWDVFYEMDDDEGEFRLLEELAERMLWLWPLWAQKQFPGRRFEAFAEDVYGPGVTLCTVGSG